MTIQSNLERRRREWRRRRGGRMRQAYRHNLWNPWNWDAWRWHYPTSTIVIEHDRPQRRRDMIIWGLALIILMGLISYLVVGKK